MSSSTRGDDAERPLFAVMTRLHAVMVRHRDEMNALNVFPVPDGDTGSNLAGTMSATCAALASASPADAEDLVATAIDGAVRGARGNSGVIFSQVIRGWLDAWGLTVSDGGLPTSEQLVSGSRAAAGLARAAVQTPVEGTILSVLDAVAAVPAVEDVTKLAQDHLAAAEAALARTPEQLPVLAAAGVVDAGGRGVVVALAALRRWICDEPEPEGSVPVLVRAREVTTWDDARPPDGRYEVMFLIDADDAAAGTLRDDLGAIGTSVVVVGTGTVVTAHVHTDEIGAAVQVGLRHGRPTDLRVTDLRDQPCDGGDADATSVVAVLPSGRLGDVGRGAGAVVVDGEAGDLPSVEDLLTAAGTGPGRTLVLPGHRNVVPTAFAAASLGGDDRLVVIEEADSVPAVLAVLAVVDSQAFTSEDIARLRDVARASRSAEVVAAVRDAETPIGPVLAGAMLVVVRGEVVGVHDDAVDAVVDAVGRIVDGHELVTIVAGADAPSAERLRVAAALEASEHDVEVELIEGGQRPVRYFVGAE